MVAPWEGHARARGRRAGWDRRHGSCGRVPSPPAVRGWRAWIGWRDGDRDGGAGAELINISPGGASTLIAEPPRAGQAVTLRIQGNKPRIRLPATVVAIRGGRLGHQVHLEFRTPCPALLLDAVIADRGP